MQVLKRKYKIKSNHRSRNSEFKSIRREERSEDKFNLSSLSSHINKSNSVKNLSYLSLFKYSKSPKCYHSRIQKNFTPSARFESKTNFKSIESFESANKSSTKLSKEEFHVGTSFAQHGFLGKKSTRARFRLPELSENIPKNQVSEAITPKVNKVVFGYKEIYLQHLLEKKQNQKLF